MPRRKRAPVSERFPVKARADGRFQKRIRGHLYYFGSESNREEALREYLAIKDQLYAGHAPAPKRTTTATIKGIANLYLNERSADADAGKLTRSHFAKLEAHVVEFCRFSVNGTPLGLRDPENLTPSDFAAYGRDLHRRFADRTINQRVANVMAMFNHAVDCGWLERPPRIGKNFRKVSESKLRGDRWNKLLQPIHIKSILLAASPQLWCMVMLGVLCGFGPGDCCNLLVSEIDWQAGFIRTRRSKTRIRRDAPLVQELIDGLRLIVRKNDDLVFRTIRGNRWDTTDVDHAFGRIVKGFTPYDLRRAFITYANECGDADAVRRIAGWKLVGLNDTYVQSISDDRLRLVVAHVRRRVLG